MNIATTDQVIPVDDEAPSVKDEPLGKGKVICPKYQPCDQLGVSETTEGQDVENVAHLVSDSPDLMIITSAPTPTPSEGGTLRGSSASADTSTTSETSEHSCTGEPCEDESWCRSQFGSCGPGFIYCNVNAIWDSSCPIKSSIQRDFYCGASWEDAVMCNKECPSGEDPECPVGQTCFADTGCKAKLSYDQFGNIVEEEEEEESEAGDSVGNGGSTVTPAPSPWRDSGAENDAIPTSPGSPAAAVALSAETAAPTSPALPALPMPTLPTITNAAHAMTNFSAHSSSAAHSGTFNSSAIDRDEVSLGGGDSTTASDGHPKGDELGGGGGELTQKNDSSRSAEAAYIDESVEQWLYIKSDGAHSLDVHGGCLCVCLLGLVSLIR